MKILHLSFKNLNSLRGSFSIDFENGPLAEAGLFAITGPTGAGKTTILDAITLGLFGKAARYDTDRGSPEHIMSRGTGECFSEVTFSCNSAVYTARWDLLRARKKADGKIQGAKRQIAKIDGEILENKIKLVDQRVMTLTGLDYARFLRSVLLAQGRFKEFLDADGKERGELLEKITGTEIYSQLSVAAHERAKEAQAIIDDSRRALAGVKLLESEEIESLKDQSRSIEGSYALNERGLKQVEERIGFYDRMQELEKEHTVLAKRIAQWELSSKSFQGSAKKISVYEQALPLAPELISWKLSKKSLAELESEMADFDVKFKKSEEHLGAVLKQLIVACTKDLASGNKALTELKEGLIGSSKLRIELQEWLKENEKDDKILESIPEIRDALDQCRSIDHRIQSALETAKSIKSRKAKSDKDHESLKSKKAKAEKAKESSVESKKKSHQRLDALLKGKKKSEWLEERSSIEAIRQKVRDLWSIQKLYLLEVDGAKTKESEWKEESKNLKKLEEDVTKLELQLKLELERLKDKETILNQAKAIASLEDRRAALIAGEPCDLCGATEHPYATVELPLKSTAEKEFEKQRKKLDTIKKEEYALQKRLSRSQEKCDQLTNSSVDLRERIDTFLNEFAKEAREAKVELKVDDRDGLLALGNQLKEKCETLDVMLKSIDAEEMAFEKRDKEKTDAENQVDSLAEQIKQVEELIKDTRLELSESEKKVVELKKSFEEAKAQFNEYVSRWYLGSNRIESMSESLKNLEKRSSVYQEKRTREAGQLQTIEKMQLSLNRQEELCALLRVEVNEWSVKLSELKIDFLGSQLKDTSKFDTVESRRNGYENVLTAKTHYESSFGAKTQDAKKLKSELETLERTFLAKIEQRGLSSIDEVDSVLKTEELVKRLRETKGKLEEERLEMNTLEKSIKKSQRDLLEKALPKEEDICKLREELESNRKELKLCAEQLGEIRNKLSADSKARSESKLEIERIEGLEKEAKPWFVLRDLIGSADGSKFSRFAQGLTLQQLVVHANRHLLELNPRYRIQRVEKADLELEILDCYEANAVRPTRSLSGGESFLMSLALALGLSELAGQNTKIQSLFIDEGFGSLDGDTLDVALSALESLRLQNRSIGVISHVEDLKIRLGTQIQVKRKKDGHAELVVVDGN